MATPAFKPFPTERLLGAVIQTGIQLGVRLLGRKGDDSTDWAVGPAGEKVIGAGIYERYAAAEGLVIDERPDAGLIVDFSSLDGPDFDSSQVHPAIAEFYEHTAQWTMDVDVHWRRPLAFAAQTLLYLVSRVIEQVNVPIRKADVKSGISSRIIPLETPEGERVYTGWLRQFKHNGAVIYAGFYTRAMVPNVPSKCVRVAFPLPRGCTTVILRPHNWRGDGLTLASSGKRFGDPGAYRSHRYGDGKVKVAYVPMHERLDLWTEDDGETVLCDHHFSLWRFEFLLLQYRMRRKIDAD